jgi:hypothetical protein
VGGRRERSGRVKAKGGEPDNKPFNLLNLKKGITIFTKINSLNKNENVQLLNFFYSSVDNIQYVSLNFENRNMR